jgi:hypothetical protein
MAAVHVWAEEVRTWTDSTGTFRREASFDRLDGKMVYLRTEEGAELKIPLEKLSAADQSFARSVVAAESDPFTESSAPRPSQESAVAENGADDDSETADPGLRVVIAEGSGTNVEKAKKDAFREAVRLVVGAFVDSSQMIKNDKLIEDRIVTLSSAYVEKASQPLTEVSEDGLVRVKVRAWVRLTKVLETLKQNNVELRVDNASFAAELQTKADQAEGADALMERAFKDFPANSFKATLVGKPEIKKASSSETSIRVSVRIEPDLTQYAVMAQKIAAAMEGTAQWKGGFSSDGKKFPKDSSAESLINYWKGGGDYLFCERRGLARILPPDDIKRLKSEVRGNSCESITGLSFFNLMSLEDSTNIDGLMNGKWGRLVPQGSDDIVFLLLTKSTNSGQRTQWKWFVLEKEEARRWYAPACKNLLVSLVLLDGDRNELLDDRFSLSQLGWRVLAGPPRVYACVPWFIGGYDADWYTPSFVYTRQIEAETGEVEGLASVECRVENSEMVDNVWGVSN